MAPAAPVFAGKPAPTGTAYSFSWWAPCGSGHAREAGDAVDGTGCAGVRGRARSHRYGAFLQLVGTLWERVHPRSRHCGGWHRLRRCSRVNPLPQVRHIPSAGGPLWERACPRSRQCGGWHRLRRCSRVNPLPQVRRIPSAGGAPVGAGMPAKQATRCMAPAAPVFAGKPAPTGTAHSFSWWAPCGSGHAREASDTVYGTGCAGVRGRARSHRYGAFLRLVGILWERVHPRSRQCGVWHRLRRCSRARPLPQVWRIPSADGVPVGAGSPAKQATRCMALWPGRYADAYVPLA